MDTKDILTIMLFVLPLVAIWSKFLRVQKDHKHPTCTCLSSSSLCSLSSRLPSSSSPPLSSPLEGLPSEQTPIRSSLSLPSAVLISSVLARSVSSWTWSSWRRLWRVRCSCSACWESWDEAWRSCSRVRVSWATRLFCSSRARCRSWEENRNMFLE